MEIREKYEQVKEIVKEHLPEKLTPTWQMNFFSCDLFVVMVFGAVILAFSGLIYYKEVLGKELPDFDRSTFIKPCGEVSKH